MAHRSTKVAMASWRALCHTVSRMWTQRPAAVAGGNNDARACGFLARSGRPGIAASASTLTSMEEFMARQAAAAESAFVHADCRLAVNDLHVCR